MKPIDPYAAPAAENPDRSPAASGRVADSPVVRRYLVAQQRALAVGRDVVCEGRDQGTIVFPDAACKFFLVADPRERAIASAFSVPGRSFCARRISSRAR